MLTTGIDFGVVLVREVDVLSAVDGVILVLLVIVDVVVIHTVDVGEVIRVIVF